MTRSLARLLNEAPEFATGVSEPSPHVFDNRVLTSDAVRYCALPPEPLCESIEFDRIWSRVFGGVCLPPALRK